LFTVISLGISRKQKTLIGLIPHQPVLNEVNLENKLHIFYIINVQLFLDPEWATSKWPFDLMGY